MGSIIDRALDIINDHLKDQTSSFQVSSPLAAGKAMARGGHVLEDDYPTHYLPNVGRQVMAKGGMPVDPADAAVNVANNLGDMPAAPEPDFTPSMPNIPAPKGAKYNTPDHIAASTVQKYQNTGLQFPEDEAFGRLHKKLRRDQKAAQGAEVAGDPANDRTVVRAPKGLPDFVSGKLTYDDWVNRHNQILNDDEIHQAADWYNRIYNTFRKYYPGEDQSKKQMRAWLVGQQNVSPAGAQQNVLLQKEQMARGVPEHLWRAGGMPNPTEAIRAVLQDKPIAGGVGQKIADFVDAAEGKPVRSWMGNHPDGGKPFVVDIHTARDTGMVDQELLNHLDRLGYNKDDLAKLKIDLTGTPTEAAYENRAAWGRGLTDHLNKIKWKGRNDWTPSEVQAVGWMGLTKLTRNAEEDVGSGLDRNMRRVSYEIDPGAGSPWESKYGSHFAELTPEEKAEITAKVADSAMSHASKLAGIDVHSLVHGTGAWEQYQNPAAVGQAQATHEGADIAANALGYLLNQTEVWHNRVKPMTANPKGFAVDFIQRGGNDLADKEYLHNFWNKVMEADDTGLFRGFQPITLPTGEVGIRALIDKGGAKTRDKIEQAVSENSPIQKALEGLGLDIDMMGHEAEITKARNDWTENKDGKGYMERLVHLVGPDRAASLNKVREDLERELEGHFEEARKRREGGAQGNAEKVKKAYGGAIYSPEFTTDPDDLARRLILWSYAAAPIARPLSREDGGRAYPVAMPTEIKEDIKAGKAKLKHISPQEFLNESDPLHIGKGDRHIINSFERHIKHGDHLGPLKLYEGGHQDGRHRANAAKALGVKKVPVIDYRKADGGTVDNAVDIARNLTPMGFYSAAAEAASKIPQRAPIDQIINKLKGSPNVKGEELDWSGVRDAFAGQKSVDPTQVAQHLQANLPQIQETVYRENDPKSALARWGRGENLVTPGHANYREVLLHAPSKAPEPETEYLVTGAFPMTFDSKDKANDYIDKMIKLREEVPALAEKIDQFPMNLVAQNKPTPASEEDFHASHWPGVPNVLAHLRMSDRGMHSFGYPEALHIEELQSDWGQKGREEGFKGEPSKFEVGYIDDDGYKSYETFSDKKEADAFHKSLIQKGMDEPYIKPIVEDDERLPVGPHVTTTEGWTDLALKRALREAAQGKYKKLTWTPGEEQADRYGLDKKFNQIHYSPDTNHLVAKGSGSYDDIDESVAPEALPNFLGKDLAAKLLDRPVMINPHPDVQGDKVQSLIGGEIKVPQKGMRDFYDRMIPNRLQKLVSKLDPEAKVQLYGHKIFVPEEEGSEEGEYRKVHSLEITPKLRAAILKGLPAYEHGGSVVDHAFKVLSRLS